MCICKGKKERERERERITKIEFNTCYIKCTIESSDTAIGLLAAVDGNVRFVPLESEPTTTPTG